MIQKGLFSQIVIVIISVALIMTYIQPTLAGIADKQDDIQVYNNEAENVIRVNSRLNQLVTDLESVSQGDRERLRTYLPTTIDEVVVMRHLLLISERAQVAYLDSQYNGDINLPFGDEEIDLIAHSFSLSVEGSYQQIKELIRLIELNEYPLEIHNLSINQLNGFFLGVSFDLVTYQYDPDVNN
jgi:hypothetical protein